MEVKPCTILDLPELYEIASKTYGEEDWLHLRIRNDLVDNKPMRARWFLLGDCAIVFEPIGVRKWQVHTFSVSRERRGKELRNFFIEAGVWMTENTQATSFLTFVPQDRVDLKLFMRSIKAFKMGDVPGVDQILYVITKEMVTSIIEKENICLSQ